MNVLFATDGGRHSELALEMLAAIGDRGRADLHVLTANGFEFAMHRAEIAGAYSPEAAQADAQRVVDETVTGLKDLGFAADGEAVEGDEPTEILRIATDRAVDLIVVGSGKERWVDAVVLGSVSTSIVHAAPCPVLVVHEVPTGDVVRVLIGADGSTGSERAIRTFAGVADPARCEVKVLSVAPTVPLPPGGTAGAVIDEPEVAEDELELARGRAEGGADILREAGFRVETTVSTGAPVRVILDAVEEDRADLVVVGARGLGRFRSKVLGSVSDRVLRKAPASLIGR